MLCREDVRILFGCCGVIVFVPVVHSPSHM
jgi:hypothetical protein